MKEHNPQNPILELAANGTPTPAMKTPKKRDLDTMVNGFQGDATGSRLQIPKPSLERDFQMCVQLNPKISVGPGIWGQRNWISFISGHWNGRWGRGTVVVGEHPPLMPTNMLNLPSLVDKTSNSLRKIFQPTSKPTISSRPMTTLQHSLRSELKVGVSGPETSWKSLTIPRNPTRWIQRATPSGSIFTWRLEIQDIFISILACGLEAESAVVLR